MIVYSAGRLLGKIVRIVAPRWAHNWPEFMTVVLSPSTPAWEYQPTVTDGPFRLIRFDHADDTVFDYFEDPDLEVVIQRLARLNMPHQEETCEVLDDNQQILIGWQMIDGIIAWCGCATAFTMLEKYHWPGEVAAWEAHARVASSRGNQQTSEAEAKWTTDS